MVIAIAYLNSPTLLLHRREKTISADEGGEEGTNLARAVRLINPTRAGLHLSRASLGEKSNGK